MECVTIGTSTLFCGDCREIIDSLHFDSIVSDPPYGLSKILNRSFDDFGKIRNKKQRIRDLHSGGTWAAKAIYQDIDWDNEAPDVTFLLEKDVPTMLFGGNYFPNLPPSRKWIIWDKGGQFYRRTFAEAELCYCNFDGNTRIITHGVVRKKKHPTEKPVQVMRFCIEELPKGSGNIILDPFMGSGSTGIAAMQMGRAFIGIEQRKDYFDIACERIEKAYAEYAKQCPAKTILETEKE